MQPLDPRSPAPLLSHFLRLESPTIMTGRETTDVLRTVEGTIPVSSADGSPPAKLVTKGKRQLVFPMPGISPSDLIKAFSDPRHYPLIDTSSGLKEQPWFTVPATPAWIGCDLSLYPNDGHEPKDGRVIPDAATLTALMLIALAQKLPPMKTGFAKFVSSTLTAEGFNVYLCLHNGKIRYNAISRREAHHELVLMVTKAT